MFQYNSHLMSFNCTEPRFDISIQPVIAGSLQERPFIRLPLKKSFVGFKMLLLNVPVIGIHYKCWVQLLKLQKWEIVWCGNKQSGIWTEDILLKKSQNLIYDVILDLNVFALLKNVCNMNFIFLFIILYRQYFCICMENMSKTLFYNMCLSLCMVL